MAGTSRVVELSLERKRTVEQLQQLGVVAVLRLRSAERLTQVVDALIAGGMHAVEITLTTPGAIEHIRAVAKRYQPTEILLGAGTVLDCEQAAAAIEAGARYIVSPTLNLDLIAYCNEQDIVVVPGAFTPTEIETAWRAGADIVKIFPANIGGPTYFRDLQGPLPQIPLLASGGVNFTTVAAYFAAGAKAVAVGGAVIGRDFERPGAFEEIRANAQRFLALIAEARGTSATTANSK